MGAVVSVLLLAALGQTIITAALPIIVGDLGGLEHISWAITAYLLAATVASPVYGKLGDMFGRKIVLQAGILVFLAGSLIAAFSFNMTMLVIARFVQGLGGGGLIVTAMAAVADVLPPRQRGRAQGVLGAAFGLSTVIGPLLGGLIVDHLSWPWLFAVNLPVGLVALAVIAFAFKGKPERVARKIDYLGATSLAAFLAALVMVTSLGGTVVPWLSPVSIGLAAVAILALATFIVAESRAAEPILPLSLFRNNAFLVSNAVGFAVGTAMFGAITFVPLFLQIVKGFSPTQAGMGLLPMMLGLIGASTAAGQIMARTGRYKHLPIASTALLAIGALLMSTITAQTPYPLVMAYLATIGCGIGPVMSVGVTAIQNAVPRAVMGVATASANMFRQTGGSVGTAVLGAVFAHHLALEVGETGTRGLSAEVIARMPPETAQRVMDGYAAALHPVFWIAAAAALFAFAIGWLLVEVPLEDTFEPRNEPSAAE
nr:MDR family MFS transporter [Pelagibacterium xiamenense]